jgi:hypothetical protein
MTRKDSLDQTIIRWIVGILIIIGFIVKLAQAMVIPILLLSIFLLLGWYFTKYNLLRKAGVLCFVIFVISLLIGFIFGNSEIGQQSQEIYLLAVNTSKILRFNP